MNMDTRPPYEAPTLKSIEQLAAEYAGEVLPTIAAHVERAYVVGFIRGFEAGRALARSQPEAANEAHA